MDAADDWMEPDCEHTDDVCHHGMPFDVDCEWCELEMDGENRAQGEVHREGGNHG